MLYVFVIFLVLIVFRSWFSFLPISSGDLGFFYKEQIIQYFNPPFMWETFRNLGFGGNSFISQGVYLYNIPLGFLGKYLDYSIVERIIWFFPILIAGCVSPLILGKVLKLFPAKFYPLISLIFLLNTYFFMIMGGGQLTVVLAYVTVPLAFALFVKMIEKTKLLPVLLFSLVFALLVSFDFRYAYIFIILMFIYTFFVCIQFRSFGDFLRLGKKYLVILFFTFVITFGIHTYWLLPFVTHFNNPVASFTAAYTTENSVKYFSFATFENSFSLFHPNWPENIFGKVSFMKPEFLFFPLLAFGSLLFLKKNKRESIHILFFAFLGLLGAFLAKGANAPFGEVYLWAFTHIPGFVMFRDPTKWYVLVALSYSILIPFTVAKIYAWITTQKKFERIHLQTSFSACILCLLTVLISPAILGQVGGALRTTIVPKEYIDYKNFLLRNSNFSRSLWVPALQRFTFYSDTHPAIAGKDYFNTFDEYGVVVALHKGNAKTLLEQGGVQYVVVPDDTQKEIFIKDRKYDAVQYTKTVEKLEKIPWLRKAYTFGKIVVFELDNPKDHFWSSDEGVLVKASMVNPTKYIISLKNAKKNDRLIFSESYDANWQATYQGKVIYSDQYDKLFNSFVLPASGSYALTVSYKPQELVYLGLLISIAMSILVSAAIIFSYLKKK